MRLIFALLFLLLGSAGFGQMAYLNSNAILVELPAIKQADTKLQLLQDSLVTQLSAKRNKLQTEFNKHQTDYQNGLLSAKKIQEITEDLNAKQEALNKEESQFQFILLQRRERLYQPTFSKMDRIVKEVAAEKGYKIVFDQAQNAGYLYMDSAIDISELVKAKM